MGGKNPAIVDKDVNINFAAKRIAWGKFWNCGQTCITSDYILVHVDVEKELINSLIQHIQDFFLVRIHRRAKVIVELLVKDNYRDTKTC